MILMNNEPYIKEIAVFDEIDRVYYVEEIEYCFAWNEI